MADQKQGWWQSHYRWVIMVIVLVLGFGLVAWFGVWLRRRHDLKRGRLLGPGQVYGNPLVAPPNKGPNTLQSRSGALNAPSVSAVPTPQARSLPPPSIASSSRTSRTNVQPKPQTATTNEPRVQGQTPGQQSAAASVQFSSETREVSQT
ncbi:hypothetical protein N7478_006033 [Penicillium angulare]|uniref:uncharacterized protein n=1 Tax=Penicillium angulare TaxID=116970 RepID=UPI002541DB06|nr:uncharacterized protein N7478_006033 [Penicillium angulare]KAJ5280661.1 hypothetical protein N7478_006033 [Penicillium angulare]